MSASSGKVYGDRRLAGSRGAETIGWLCTVWRLVVLALGVLLAPLAAEAPQAGEVPRIGFLDSVSPAPVAPRVEAFRQGLRELGYVEGKNLAIEYRYAEGSPTLLHDLAAELVYLKVDVILAPDTNAALAAKQATATIPIVFASVADPIGRGLAASLARPGGNATGLTPISAE